MSATSTDGRSFTFEAVTEHSLVAGHFVALLDEDGRVILGQIDTHIRTGAQQLSGTGQVLGVVGVDGGFARDSQPFTDLAVALASEEVIKRLHSALGATLRIGTLESSPGVPAALLPHRFNRHTFWCGQSGSGKTYALGVLLEQLLIHTELPMVIFDPNADFVRLNETRDDADPASAARLRSRDIRVLRPGTGQGDHLRARFLTFPLRVKAAILGLDPVVDRAEYNTMLHLEESLRLEDTKRVVENMSESANVGDGALALRIENLGLLSWQVWAGAERAATEIIAERPHATVLDLGGFQSSAEPLIVALSVLEDLWARREERRPVLLVIDEAHNLCSPDATTPLQVALREQIIQIAAEGRKYGLWLLLSTQRPSKIHPSIISQCDNLALMKMSSPLDLRELAAVFGFAPEALLAQSPLFRQGEALFAGGFAPAPSVVRVRERLTYEGGVDVRVPLVD